MACFLFQLVSASVCVIPATAAYDKTTTHSNKDSLNEHVNYLWKCATIK